MTKFEEKINDEITILLVIDNEYYKDIFLEFCSQKYHTTVAENISQAVKLIEKEYFNIVIIEEMPMKKCDQLINFVKKKCDAGILFLSASTSHSDVEDIVDETIIFPVSLGELEYKIINVYERYQFKKRIKAIEEEVTIKRIELNKISTGSNDIQLTKK